MTSLRRLMTAACIVAGLSGLAKAQSFGDDIQYALEAYQQSVSPVADGNISENEYASSEFVSFVNLENPGNVFPPLNQMCGAEFVDCNDDDPVDGDEDLSVTVYWGYTLDAFYMGFDVTDQTINADEEELRPWHNDGVMIFLDPDADGEDQRNWSLEGMQLIEDTTGNEAFSNGDGPVWVESDPGPGEWTTGYKLTNKGYVMEFQVPLASLDMEPSDPPTIDADEAVPTTPGHTIRMNFAITDIDVELGDDRTSTHAMWWVDEDQPGLSPWGGAEGNWVVGMTLAGPVGVDGDFNGNGQIDTGDLDVHSQYIKDANPAGDVDGDGDTDVGDRQKWVEDLQHSWLGDSNFDGEFNSSDFVAVFQTGKFEQDEMATYAEGDWNGDMRFGSGDFVVAFQHGGYERGPQAAAVPEPTTAALFAGCALGLLVYRDRRLQR